MSRKRVALSLQTPRRSNKKRRRHNDDIHDEDVENQQPSPHPMPPIILPHAFVHAPNTFKLVSHIGAMNNTSSTVLKSQNVVYSMRSCPKTQALSQKVFTIIFAYIVPKPKLYLYKFFTILFPYIAPNPKQSQASQLVKCNYVYVLLFKPFKHVALICTHYKREKRIPSNNDRVTLNEVILIFPKFDDLIFRTFYENAEKDYGILNSERTLRT